MRKPTTWRPLADLVVAAVREKQVFNSEYRGLISCMEAKDADAVKSYLEERYPGLRVRIAISADGTVAQRALQEFKTEPADILVTVRMAFIGYDCPKITVVGVLTHYRDPGHLMQLIGRGLRTWDAEPADEQSCRVIAPDDLKMNAFLSQLREQSDEGIRRKQERERDRMDGSPRDASGTDPLTFIEGTDMTTRRLVGPDVEIEHDEVVLYEAIKRKHGAAIDTTVFAAMVEDLGMRAKGMPDAMRSHAPEPEPEPEPAEVLTDRQQIERINGNVVEIVKASLSRRGIRGGRSDYHKFITEETIKVNKAAGLSAQQVRTVEQAEARLAAARRVCGGA